MFFDRAKRHGWHECCCPEGRETRSFFRERTGEYQLDHVFCDTDTAGAVERCEVWADRVALEVSDHAPVICDVRVGSGGSA